jgi:hypothetical protein
MIACAERNAFTASISATPMLSPPGHDALHQSGNERKNCTSGASTNNQTKNCPDIEPTARAGNRRHQDLHKLTGTDAAKGAGDRVADNAGTIGAPTAFPPAIPATT